MNNETVIALAVPPVDQIGEEARSRNWRILHLWFCDYILPKHLEIKGAIVDSLPDHISVRELQNQGCKVVRIGRVIHELDSVVPAIIFDLEAQGVMAAEHFFERGFSDVCYFGRKPWSNSQLFFNAFEKRSLELGMNCYLYQFSRVEGEDKATTEERKEREFGNWIHDLPKPVGLLSPGDAIASRYVSWINRLKYSIPLDVAVLSRHNQNNACKYSLPNISYINIDHENQLHQAFIILEDLIKGKPLPKASIKIKPIGIGENESTNIIATPDKYVASALSFMWKNIADDLSVADIAQIVNLSERQLSRRFQKAIGRSINKELQRKRLEVLKYLLRTTDFPISKLGLITGYRSIDYLHRTFLSEFGITPGQYRLDNQ